MTKHIARLAVFPGTFDPITNGHVDVVHRGARLFDQLVVAVGDNPHKAALLDAERRVQTVRQALADVEGVRVQGYTGLTVDLVRSLGADVILRGLRSEMDWHFEYQMAQTNRAIGGVETVFLPARPEHAYLSSTLIRQIAGMGGDVSGLVPAAVLAELKAL